MTTSCDFLRNQINLFMQIFRFENLNSILRNRYICQFGQKSVNNIEDVWVSEAKWNRAYMKGGCELRVDGKRGVWGCARDAFKIPFSSSWKRKRREKYHCIIFAFRWTSPPSLFPLPSTCTNFYLLSFFLSSLSYQKTSGRWWKKKNEQKDLEKNRQVFIIIIFF